MRKMANMILAMALCLILAVPASAAFSNPGGHHKHHKPISPKTGSSTVAVLALSGCAAGGVGVAAYKKSKE